MVFSIEQTVKIGHVQGRNGCFDNTAVIVWTRGDRVYFDCKGRLGMVLNAGFSMDIISFARLMDKLKAIDI